MATTTLYFVHPDHLGTPRVVADAAGVTVWRWDNLEPFGLTGVQTDPDGNGQAFVFNLRFAGQYFDAESGLFHNRHRDYDSASGRYVQADPIGLAGGISLYSYVGANPLGFVDPLGLARQCGASGDAEQGADVTQRSVSPKTLMPRQGPNEMTGSRVERYKKAMKKDGYGSFPPIDAANAEGRLVIIDGHHRAVAASRAGLREVPVNVRNVNPDEASALLREAAEAMSRRY